MNDFNDWQHGVLPSVAQQILRAATTEGTPGSVARRRAVEQAISHVYRVFPQFFKPHAGVIYAEATK